MKIIDIIQQTNSKFLNLFDIVYELNGKEKHWLVASRNSKEALACLSSQVHADTVSVVPKCIDKDGDEAVILNKEFRIPVNDYVYSFVSGCVDPSEDAVTSCVRELEEEIGAGPKDITQLSQLTDVTFKSEGMSDETAVIFEAIISGLGKQNLQGSEDIKVEIVKIKDLPKYIQGKKLSTMAGIYLPMMYREYMLTKQLEEKNNAKNIPPQPGN